MQVKAKIKNGIVEAKAMFTSAMAGREEAEKKGVKPEFIAHIIASVNGKIVYEISTGPFISKNPLFKFQFTGAEQGDIMVITATDNNGKQESENIKIK